MDSRARIEEALGEPVVSLKPLQGGCVSDVYRVRTGSGWDLVAKCAPAGTDGGFIAEAEMLGTLGEVAPVPRVRIVRPDILVMEHVDNAGGGTPEGYHALGATVARIHGVRSDRFGHTHPTRIREITLENPWSNDWSGFYFASRLRPLAALAHQIGGVTEGFCERIDRLGDRIGGLIGDSGGPCLIHGDLWSGNMLWSGGRIAALIDPLSFYADPEFELAFIALMGGVPDAFWEGYGSVRSISGGFWEVRVHLYQIVPLLVHAVLFGGGYGDEADTALRRVERSV